MYVKKYRLLILLKLMNYLSLTYLSHTVCIVLKIWEILSL